MRLSPEFEPEDPRNAGGDGDDLDEDFPLGDGTADLEASANCPYCAEAVTVSIDPGSGAAQDYVEDCPVCCQPWQVSVRYASDGTARIQLDSL